MTTALLVNAKDNTITRIKCDGYKDMVKHLPGGITIGKVFDNGDVLYVDDEALLRPAECAFKIKGRLDGQPMMSNGILTGRDPLDPETTPEQLQEQIEWMTVEDALSWFRARERETSGEIRMGDAPPVTISRWGDFLKNLEGKPGGFDPTDSKNWF